MALRWSCTGVVNMACSTVITGAIAFVLLVARPSSAQSPRPPTYEYLRMYPSVTVEGTQPLFFGLMKVVSVALPVGEYDIGSVTVPSVEVALDQINDPNSTILPGYTLHYLLADSQVSSACLCDTALPLECRYPNYVADKLVYRCVVCYWWTLFLL